MMAKGGNIVKQRLAAMALAFFPICALASSEKAWDEYRQMIDRTCRSLVDAPATANVRIEVNPFGSDSYGAALVTVTYETGQDRMICIHHKATGKGELTAPFADAALAQ